MMICLHPFAALDLVQSLLFYVNLPLLFLLQAGWKTCRVWACQGRNGCCEKNRELWFQEWKDVQEDCYY